MASNFEKVKQRLSDVGQQLSEFMGLEPVFKHNPGCTVRGGLTIKVEDFEDKSKIKITRTCGKCGVADSYVVNKITDTSAFRSGW